MVTPIPLTDLADVKNYLGISSVNQDYAINALIPVASAYIKSYCSRSFVDFVANEKTESIIDGVPYIVLAEYPVLQVVGVEQSTNGGQNWTALANYTGYAVDIYRGTVHSIATPTFPAFPTITLVRYYGGFAEDLYVPGLPRVPKIPPDIAQACIMLVDYYMKNNTAVHNNANAAMGNTTIQYTTNPKLPTAISTILDQYVRDYV